MPTADRVSSDEDGVVIACPECDKAGDVYRRHRSNTHIGDPEDPFACGKCSATFEEPVERPPKPSGPRASLIREVQDVLGDGGGD